MSKNISAIGIDLGTTYSKMAYIDKNGVPNVILNFESEILTPSVVHWKKDEKDIIITTVGEDAVLHSITDHGYTVSHIKGRPLKN